MTSFLAIGALVALSLSACGGGEPADVAGSYTISVTNGENGCNVANWTQGETTAGIPVAIVQSDVAVTATVEGLVGAYLQLVLGSNVFTGEVDGDDMSLTLYGTTSATQGNCTFTYNSTIDATISGDVLTGSISYTPATVGNPDCAAIEGCVTTSAFNGTRPPTQ